MYKRKRLESDYIQLFIKLHANLNTMKKYLLKYNESKMDWNFFFPTQCNNCMHCDPNSRISTHKIIVLPTKLFTSMNWFTHFDWGPYSQDNWSIMQIAQQNKPLLMEMQLNKGRIVQFYKFKTISRLGSCFK